MLLPSKIILHCSATEDGPSKSWDAIKRYHTEERGWNDIGYHYGIEIVDGDIMVYRGRPWWDKGAHCRAAGRNHDSLGVCVVGKFDDAEPSTEIYNAALKVLEILCAVFQIRAEKVYGHSEFESGKTCPGRKWDMAAFRRDLRGILQDAEEQQGMKIGEAP